MQTQIDETMLASPAGHRANEILRSCVHCGFCNAVCPTYRLTGDERDGPRGRIYLIKHVLEGVDQPRVAQTHLDRCLTCRACETVCPSGVQYGELLEIGRATVERRNPRKWRERLLRQGLRWLMPNPDLFRWMSALALPFRRLLPAPLRSSLEGLARARRSANELRTSSTLPSANVSGTPDTAGTVVVLQGCVQRAATPDVTGAFRTIVEARGWRVRTVTQEGCCGALPLHLGFDDDARTTARKMVDALVPMLDDVEAIVSSASGCGVTVKDYGRLLADDPDYADAAHSVASKVVDASEFCARYLGASSAWQRVGDRTRVAWHAPCTFQHGQRLGGVVEAILESAGYRLCRVENSATCCGSAGTYSITQRTLSEQLLRQKIRGLTQESAEVIATANVGCQLHLASATEIPVVHWLQLVR